MSDRFYADMEWYDPKVSRYRCSVVWHVCYGHIGWSIMRWCAFHLMSSERAHHIGMRAIGWIATVDYFVTGWRRNPPKWMLGESKGE